MKKASRTSAQRHLAQQAESELKKALAWNMSQGPNALRHKDGYIIIGEQAYGSKEAYKVALKDLDYFQEHDIHLSPLPYPATSDLKKQYYPDVTKKVQGILSKIRQEIKQADIVQKNRLILTNFPNDKAWDLQVNHGLPGQVLELNLRSTKILKDHGGKVKTRDQYAVFKGEIRQAGYISNYAFGYAAAVAGWPRIAPGTLANIAALPGRDGDNPKDIKAMQDGWDAYWKEVSP